MSTAEKQFNPVAEFARTYSAATVRRDLDAMQACWGPGGIKHSAAVVLRAVG